MRTTRLMIALAAVTMLASAGCTRPKPAASSAPATTATEAAAAGATRQADGPAAGSNQARAEGIMRSVDRPFAPIPMPDDDPRQAATEAKHVAGFRVPDPALRLFLFEYGSVKEAAAHIQDVVVWINGSGLIHNGEATLAKHAIVVVGTENPGEVTPELRASIDEYMDAAIVAQ